VLGQCRAEAYNFRLGKAVIVMDRVLEISNPRRLELFNIDPEIHDELDLRYRFQTASSALN
jgi:hypothetical protein